MKLILLISFMHVVLFNHVIYGNEIKQTSIEEEWWRSGVFYQIYPRSFMDSGEGAIGEGDLRGVINRLEHLKDLGVTGTWLNPIFKSPMKDGGYDIADFYNVDERYGTNQDLEDLFAKAKELGLRVLMDLVPNHTSDQHEWFQKSVRREQDFEEFYVWHNCSIYRDANNTIVIDPYPNNWRAVFHTPAWSYNEVRGQCYLHQFLAGQPDLNYRNQKVVEAMTDVLYYWIDKGADGFRIDAINHMFEEVGFPNETLTHPQNDPTLYASYYHNNTRDLQETYDVVFNWRRLIDEYTAAKGLERKFLMTEAYAEIDLLIKWYGTEDIPGSHMPFNFALITNVNRDSTAQDFQKAVDDFYSRLPPFGEGNWVLGNHDRPRIGYRYGDNRHESLAMMAMLLPGISVIYYGEEILMTDNREITWEQTDDPEACNTNSSVYQLFTRDPVRTPFQWDGTKNAGFSSADKTWLPVHRNYAQLNLQLQKAAPKSTFKYYQHLLALRKTDIFKFGDFRSRAVNQQIFAFVRKYQSLDPVTVFINLGAKTVVSVRSLLRLDEIPANARGRIIAATSTSNYNIDDIINTNQFELGTYDAIAFVVEEDNSSTNPPTTNPPSTTPGGAATVIGTFFLVISSILMSLL